MTKNDDIELDIIGDIRSICLDDMGRNLTRLGFSKEEIAKARKESVELDSDEPMLKLLQTNPIFKLFSGEI